MTVHSCLVKKRREREIDLSLSNTQPVEDYSTLCDQSTRELPTRGINESFRGLCHEARRVLEASLEGERYRERASASFL